MPTKSSNYESESESDFEEERAKKISPTKELAILKNLKKFFYNKDEGKLMVKLIKKKHPKKKVSLRVFDWFVTNYCKKNNVTYKVESIESKSSEKQKSYVPFNVYDDYRSQLTAFTKEFFDPFNRTEKIDFEYNSSKDPINTTICQLNFFKWVISNKIFDYIVKHFDDIVEDMREVAEEQREFSKKYYEGKSDESELKSDNPDSLALLKKKYRKPRQKLSQNLNKEVHSYTMKVMVSLD